jgi:penicillin-binding protein 1A
MAAPIQLQKRDVEETASADFFAEEVRRKLAAMYGSNALYEGGLTVRTTVNPELQKAADKALRDALVAYDRRYGYRGALAKMPSVANWEEELPLLKEVEKTPLFDKQQIAVVLEVTPEKATIGLPTGERGSIPLSELKWAREDLPLNRVGAEVRAASDVLNVGDVIIAFPLKGSETAYGLHQIPEINGAMVAINPHNGRVLAMSGGYAYGGTEFNRATQAKRQPGSAFKPFVYVTALENGFTPSTILMDEPVEISQGPGLPMWRPQNYEGRFLGAITLRAGLEKSRNTLTVRLAQMVGIGRIINVAQRFGIYTKEVPRNYSMVLGAHETTLMDLATAYAMIANGGRKIEASLIERIDDRNGDILFRRDKRPCDSCLVPIDRPSATVTPPLLDDVREIVLDPRIAYQITSILEGVVKRGTGTKALAIGKPVGGKTGTTNDSRDAWFVGYSPDLVAGVYIGYDQPKSLGAKETGGAVALPAFVSFMQAALKDEPATEFRVPPGITIMQVDATTGQPPYGESHGRLIDEAILVGGNIYRPDAPEGAVEEEPMMAIEDAIQQEGFDPDAGWENSNYYMTPDEARRRDQQMQMEFRRPNPQGTLPPAVGNYDPNHVPSQAPAPAQGYDVNGGNPYEGRAINRNNQPSNVNTGTGGLY